MFYDEGGEALAQVAQRGGRCPSLESFQARLDGALRTLTRVKMSLLAAGGRTRRPRKVPSNPTHSVIQRSDTSIVFQEVL